MEINVLSIDAWADMGGWQWNAWYRVDSIDSDTLATLDTDAKILAWFVEAGLLKPNLVVGTDVEIEDDGYNIVISDMSVIDAPEDCEDSERCEHQHCAMPIYAIAYGEVVS